MLYSKAHFAVRHAAANAGRPSLHGIHFKADGSTEATDGHILFQVKAETPDDDEYPAVGGIKSSTEELVPFTMPLDACEAIAKSIPKRNTRYMPVLSHAALDVAETNANGKARFVTSDLTTTTPIESEKIDGTYPNTDAVIPKIDGKCAFAIDLNLLVKVAKAAKEYRAGTGGRTNMIAAKFYVTDDMSPIRIEIDDAGDTFTAIVMPVRV